MASLSVKSLSLLYLPLRARAEAARMMLRYAGIPFDDQTVSFQDWMKKKDDPVFAPSGQLPVLVVEKEDGGTSRIAQSGSICRFVADIAPKELKLMPDCPLSKAEVDQVYELAQEMWEINPIVNRMKNKGPEREEAEEKFFSQLPRRLAFAQRSLDGGKHYVGGDKPCYADFSLFHILDNVTLVRPGSLEDTPILSAWFDRMKGLDAVAAYITERPQVGSRKVGMPSTYLWAK